MRFATRSGRRPGRYGGWRDGRGWYRWRNGAADGQTATDGRLIASERPGEPDTARGQPPRGDVTRPDRVSASAPATERPRVDRPRRPVRAPTPPAPMVPPRLPPKSDRGRSVAARPLFSTHLSVPEHSSTSYPLVKRFCANAASPLHRRFETRPQVEAMPNAGDCRSDHLTTRRGAGLMVNQTDALSIQHGVETMAPRVIVDSVSTRSGRQRLPSTASTHHKISLAGTIPGQRRPRRSPVARKDPDQGAWGHVPTRASRRRPRRRRPGRPTPPGGKTVKAWARPAVTTRLTGPPRSPETTRPRPLPRQGLSFFHSEFADTNISSGRQSPKTPQIPSGLSQRKIPENDGSPG
jgi:hypothetical protein